MIRTGAGRGDDTTAFDESTQQTRPGAGTPVYAPQPAEVAAAVGGTLMAK